MASAAHSGDTLNPALQLPTLCFLCKLARSSVETKTLSQQEHEKRPPGVQVCVWRDSADSPLWVLVSSSIGLLAEQLLARDPVAVCFHLTFVKVTFGLFFPGSWPLRSSGKHPERTRCWSWCAGDGAMLLTGCATQQCLDLKIGNHPSCSQRLSVLSLLPRGSMMRGWRASRLPRAFDAAVCGLLNVLCKP